MAGPGSGTFDNETSRTIALGQTSLDQSNVVGSHQTNLNNFVVEVTGSSSGALADAIAIAGAVINDSISTIRRNMDKYGVTNTQLANASSEVVAEAAASVRGSTAAGSN